MRRRPGALVAGADFAREMLKVGTHKLAGRPGAAGHIAAHAADGHQLPYASRAFDGAFSGFCVRNLHDLPRALVELRRVVRPGGTIVILEFFRPASPQRWSRLFFDRFYNARVLPLLGWAVTGDKAAYQYLPASIARLPVADGVRGRAASWPASPRCAARTCSRARWPRWWWRDEAGGGRRRRLGLDLRPAAAGHAGRRRPAAWPTCRSGWCFSKSGAEVWQHELGKVPDYPFQPLRR